MTLPLKLMLDGRLTSLLVAGENHQTASFFTGRFAVVILVIDDEFLMRDIVSEALMEDGQSVVEANNAEDALELVLRGGLPEAIVTDVYLGAGMNGLTLAEEVHRVWPHVGVVIMTGTPEAVTGRVCATNERLLYKPFSASALTAAVRQVMPVAETYLHPA
jgi:DNA-binding NtrC family response regulator